MRNIRTYTVVPSLPKPIEALREIALNMWWTWTQDARELFIRLDRDLWEKVNHNPVALLGLISQARLKAASEDQGFLAHLERVKLALDTYMEAKTWYDQYSTGKKPTRIAYFSAEFGLHECLPIYSGGLGLLSGDHCKSASGLGLPFVGVGLYYYNGYCHQYLNADGWQQEYLTPNDFYNLPSTLVVDKNGAPIKVSIELPAPEREVKLQIWRVQVGRIPLFLLDARLDENRPEDRILTDQLYGGDHEHRMRQEIVLGIGGLRALRAMNAEPEVCHMNEGHAGFLALERMRILIQEKGLSFEQAREAVIPGNVFTTHTPVPAGIDMFGVDLMDKYFGNWHGKLKTDRKTFLALGRFNPHDDRESFNMAVMALKMSAFANGVSALHGEVSRKMFKHLWPEVPESEVPITSITNGVHVRSYASDQLNELYVRYSGLRWSLDTVDPGHDVKGPDLLPDSELWRVHERRRARLVIWARERLKAQLQRRGVSPREVEMADSVLDPEALTIGFARRFATYKRGTLLFKDADRLAKLLNDKSRPVQFIFAGKAHPKDEAGKKFIQAITQVARDERFRKRLVFIEDYDINVARYLVQGVDVWLNNPRRPMEASGTSGMKAAANGALNCSILDGWWVEGYDGVNGWAIGRGEDYSDYDYQDQVESRSIYDLLEQQIVPTFYERQEGIPSDWVKRMKAAMKSAMGFFNTHRMVREYTERFYVPAGERWRAVNGDNCRPACELWDWKMALYQKWAQVRIEHVEAKKAERVLVGNALEVMARIHVGPIDPNHVDVQVYHGNQDQQGNIVNGKATSMERVGGIDNGIGNFVAKIPCTDSGRFGYTVRVVPKHPNLAVPFIPGLITWG